jgi:hypothetical protein
MSQPPDDAGPVTPSPIDDFPEVRSRRPVLWLLLVPAVLYCAAPLVANRIEPRILGVPFLVMWLIAATVISPIIIWIISRYDPAYRSDAAEPIPADDLPGGAARTGGGAR